VSVANYHLKTPSDDEKQKLPLAEHLKSIKQDWKTLEARN
jgi:hypothetical protein